MMKTAIAATSWGPDRCDLFGTSLGGKVFHGVGSTWETVSDLGAFSVPAVTSRSTPKQLDVIGWSELSNAMCHSVWTGSWSSEKVGGPLGRAPAAAWLGNRLHVVGLDDKGGVVERVRIAGSSWAAGTIQPFASSSQPAIVALEPGRLYAFALDHNSRMSYNAGDGANWSGWKSLGSQQFVSPPVASAWATNRVDVFGVGADGQILHRNLADPGSTWEALKGGLFASPPVLAVWPDLGLHVFAVGVDGHLYQKFFWKQSQTWSPSPDDWQPIGGTLDSPPAVVAWQDAASGLYFVDVFALGPKNHMCRKHWDPTVKKWSDWEALNDQIVFHPAPGP